MKRFFAMLLAILMLCALVGCGGGTTAPKTDAETAEDAPAAEAKPDKVYKLTLSTQAAESSTNATWLKQIAEKISEVTDGQVELEIYYSSTLVGETDVVSAIKGGLCDVGEVGMGRNTNLFPLTGLIMEPYSNLGDGATFYDNVFTKLWDEYPELREEYAGLKIGGMLIATNGGTVHAVKEVRVPSDMAGLKLSCVTPFQTGMTEAGGGAPMSLEASEWYTSFQYGVADGMWMTWGAITSMNLYEVLPYHTMFPNGTDRALTCLLFNEDVWNSLPEDCQEAIEGIVGWTCSIWPAIEEEDFNTSRATMEDAGCTFLDLTEEEEAEWAAAAEDLITDDVEAVDALGLPGTAFYESVKAYGAEN